MIAKLAFLNLFPRDYAQNQEFNTTANNFLLILHLLPSLCQNVADATQNGTWRQAKRNFPV
jgi:hypothetical protein